MRSSSGIVKGTKRKIEIKKRDTKQQRAVACSKRRHTVFSKAADLCFLAGANIAVFVTSPADNSDVVYSFSGYSPASEIADCYLNNKPPPKIISPNSASGYWWEDPNLYESCDDLSELSTMEDRLEKLEKHLMACLAKKEKSQIVSNFDQNPSPSYHVDEICGDSFSFDPNRPSSPVEEIYGQFLLSNQIGDEFGFLNCLSENKQISKAKGMVNDSELGLNNRFGLDENNNTTTTNEEEEEDYLIDISEYLNEEYMEFS